MAPEPQPPLSLTNEGEIGARIREIRKNLSMSLQTVSDRADVSVGTLSQVERGLSFPSLRTLQKICTALGVPLSWLFHPASEEEEERDQIVVRAGHGAQLHVPTGGYDKVLLSPPDFDGLQIMRIRLEPHAGTGSEAYTHPGLDAGYVLAGSLHLEVEGKLYVLATGDSFAFDSQRPHRFENRGAVAAEIIWVTTQSASSGH